MPTQFDAQDRRQRRLRRLRTQNPRCVICGESDPRALELHHLAGKRHSDDEAIVCANHHRILSDQQLDHVPAGVPEPTGQVAHIAHYLLGLADLFAMIVEAFRKFAAWLLEQARGAVAS